jgi:hypothetical protein
MGLVSWLLAFVRASDSQGDSASAFVLSLALSTLDPHSFLPTKQEAAASESVLVTGKGSFALLSLKLPGDSI